MFMEVQQGLCSFKLNQFLKLDCITGSTTTKSTGKYNTRYSSLQYWTDL